MVQWKTRMRVASTFESTNAKLYLWSWFPTSRWCNLQPIKTFLHEKDKLIVLLFPNVSAKTGKYKANVKIRVKFTSAIVTSGATHHHFKKLTFTVNEVILVWVPLCDLIQQHLSLILFICSYTICISATFYFKEAEFKPMFYGIP